MFFLWFWVHVGAFVCFIWPSNVWDQLKEMETAPVVCVRWFLCSCFLCLVNDFDEENRLKSLVCVADSCLGLSDWPHLNTGSISALLNANFLLLVHGTHFGMPLIFFSVLYFCSCIFWFCLKLALLIWSNFLKFLKIIFSVVNCCFFFFFNSKIEKVNAYSLLFSFLFFFC